MKTTAISLGLCALLAGCAVSNAPAVPYDLTYQPADPFDPQHVWAKRLAYELKQKLESAGFFDYADTDLDRYALDGHAVLYQSGTDDNGHAVSWYALAPISCGLGVKKSAAGWGVWYLAGRPSENACRPLLKHVFSLSPEFREITAIKAAEKRAVAEQKALDATDPAAEWKAYQRLLKQGQKKQAEAHFKNAVEKEYPPALYAYAVRLERDARTEMGRNDARAFMIRAANAGSVPAQLRMGNTLMNEARLLGSSRLYFNAQTYFEMAAGHGNKEAEKQAAACGRLAELLLKQGH